MTTKSENFKAVSFMRKRRDALSRLHAKNPEIYFMQLKEVHLKYGFKDNEKDLALTHKTDSKKKS